MAKIYTKYKITIQKTWGGAKPPWPPLVADLDQCRM